METNRSTLRLLTESDLPDVLEMFKEPNTFEYIKGLQDKSDTFYLDFLRLKIQEIESGKGFYWIIRTKDSSELVGAINLTPIPKTENMQIGWQIKDQFRQQGYAYQSAKLAMEFALKETDFHPIYGVFEKANIASEKILKKLHFEHHETSLEGKVPLEKWIFFMAHF